MKKIEDAMNFKIYDYKTGAVAEDKVAVLVSPDGMILSIGNDMNRPEAKEYLKEHPEIQMLFPIEDNKITDYDKAFAMIKYFNQHYLFPKNLIHMKPKYSALIYHGYMSEDDKEKLTKILLDIGNMNAIVLSSDEILEGYSSLDEAIQGLPDKYKKIRAAFEIKA